MHPSTLLSILRRWAIPLLLGSYPASVTPFSSSPSFLFLAIMLCALSLSIVCTAHSLALWTFLCSACWTLTHYLSCSIQCLFMYFYWSILNSYRSLWSSGCVILIKIWGFFVSNQLCIAQTRIKSLKRITLHCEDFNSIAASFDLPRHLILT